MRNRKRLTKGCEFAWNLKRRTSAFCASGCSIKVRQSTGSPFRGLRDFINGAMSTALPLSLSTNTLSSLCNCNSFQQQRIHSWVKKNDRVNEDSQSSAHSLRRFKNSSSRLTHSISNIHVPSSQFTGSEIAPFQPRRSSYNRGRNHSAEHR